MPTGQWGNVTIFTILGLPAEVFGASTKNLLSPKNKQKMSPQIFVSGPLNVKLDGVWYILATDHLKYVILAPSSHGIPWLCYAIAMPPVGTGGRRRIIFKPAEKFDMYKIL